MIIVINLTCVLCLFAPGSNAGKAFGIAGIGTYGKRLFRRNGGLYCEFKFRARPYQKIVERVRIPVDVSTTWGIDKSIREWLYAKKPQKSVDVVVPTLFQRVIDRAVQQCSYMEFHQNVRRIKSGRPASPMEKRK